MRDGLCKVGMVTFLETGDEMWSNSFGDPKTFSSGYRQAVRDRSSADSSRTLARDFA